MSTTLSTAPGRHDHPPQPTAAARSLPFDPRQLGLVDRAALHLGLALIAWGRRPRAWQSRERRASTVEQRIAQLDRAHAAERLARLHLPIR